MVTVVDVVVGVVAVVEDAAVVDVVDVLVVVPVLPVVQATINAKAPINRAGLSMQIQRLQTHARSVAS